MTVDELLAILRMRGVRLSVNGDRLLVDGPMGAITSDLRTELAELKADVMTTLANARGQNETNEIDEAPNSEPPIAVPLQCSWEVARVSAMAAFRGRLSKQLQHWDDEHLIALIAWHLAMAFDRGGVVGFRRYLPRPLAHLLDEEIAALVEWTSLASMEDSLWQRDAETAAKVSRGAQKLATWWNVHREKARQTDGPNQNVSPSYIDARPRLSGLEWHQEELL